MNVIFVIGATLSFFLAFLVFSKKNKTAGDYVLGSYLAVFGLYFIILYLDSIAIKYPQIINLLGFNIPLLGGPFIFLYVLVMVKTNNKFKAVYWLHGLPYLLFNLYSVLYFYFPDAAKKTDSINITLESISIFKISFYLVANAVYVIWAIFILNKHKKKLGENFSYTEDIDLVWLKLVVSGFGAFWVVVLILHLFDKYPITAISPLGYAIYLTLTLYIFFLGYFGLKQQAIYTSAAANINKIDGTDPVIKKKEPYKHSVLKQTEAKKYLEKLLDYFNKEKPYLKGKLNIKEVSEYMDISVHHLSQLINEQLNKNFYDFVNGYRVQEVKARLFEPKYAQLTLLAIAYDCGFNSKSSFNSVFKKHTGLTPSQYLKQKTT
jgi:AraC-like DNA-binding protein